MRTRTSELTGHLRHVQLIVCQSHLKRGIGVVTAFLKRHLIFQSHTDICVEEMIPCLGFSCTQLGRSRWVAHRTGCAQLADSQRWKWARRAVLPAFHVLQTSHNIARESHTRALSLCSLAHLTCPNVEGNWSNCMASLQDEAVRC